MMTEQKIILQNFNHRRKKFDDYLEENQIDLATCPSCGYPTLTAKAAYEICSVCDWEDDGQNDTNADQILGGPNGKLSLTQSRGDIGVLLADLADKKKGEINLRPDEVVRILKTRESELDQIRNDINKAGADVDNPLWKKLEDFRISSLERLINVNT